MLISALMLFVLLVMIVLFSVLTSFPYAIALSTSLLVMVLKFTTAASVTRLFEVYEVVEQIALVL